MVFTLLFFGCDSTPKMTIYDDGKSCPYDCAPHVVMDKKLNGTKYAFDPASSSKKPGKCTLNGDCKICFDDKATQCVVTKYRGPGPPKNTFDLTAEFYEALCDREDAPKAIKTKCSAFQKQAKELKDYINCIAQLEHTKCLVMIQAAKHKKPECMPYYVQCNKLGQEAYNIGKPYLKKTHP